MKETINKILKNKILFLILVSFIGGITIAYAVTYFPSNQVTYDNKTSGLNATEVQTAIDELYSKAKNCSSKSKYLSFSAAISPSTHQVGVIFSDNNGIYSLTLGDNEPVKLTKMTANSMDVYAVYNSAILYFSNNSGIYYLNLGATSSSPTKLTNETATSLKILYPGYGSEALLMYSNANGIYYINLNDSSAKPQKVY